MKSLEFVFEINWPLIYSFYLLSILPWSYQELVSMIQQEYPDFQRLDDAKNDTSKAWKVPGFKV